MPYGSEAMANAHELRNRRDELSDDEHVIVECSGDILTHFADRLLELVGMTDSKESSSKKPRHESGK
jgi:hypothetical protein